MPRHRDFETEVFGLNPGDREYLSEALALQPHNETLRSLEDEIGNAVVVARVADIQAALVEGGTITYPVESFEELTPLIERIGLVGDEMAKSVPPGVFPITTPSDFLQKSQLVLQNYHVLSADS
jgi:hypothetical protein